MFSFLKFLNYKSGDDKNGESNSLSGKTLNLNSAEAKALNVFNNKSPNAHKPSGSSTLLSNRVETVTSPGFSFRIVQKAREMRPTTPITDVSNLSASYTLENSLNSSNTVNGNNITPRDVYDKKRKLMETLDNFGVRKRIRQENGVDAFVNRRRRTISESNAPDRISVMNGYNHRLPQPISTVMSHKSATVESKKIKRYGDFEPSSSHTQKKPRTRNNEILSSYSSSKFLLTSGQKRPYPTDHESESPSRKHCKSCTCCGSTVLLDNGQNNLNKSDKTTETDLSDDLVTVAASRIFNRSGRTQVVKKICMKTVLDEVFDDIDPAPYTSIEKVVEKKRKAQENVISKTDKSNAVDHSVDSVVSSSSAITSKFNETRPAITSILSVASSTASVSSATLTTTPSVQFTTPLTFGVQPSENNPKVNEGDTNKTPLQFNFGSPIVSTASSNETNHQQVNEVDGKLTDNPIHESTNVTFTLKMPTTTKSAVKNADGQHKLFHSPEKENVTNDKPQICGQNDTKSDKDKFQFTVPASEPSQPVINLSTFSESPKKIENSLPALQFGSQVENSLKQPAFTFGVPKADEKQSTPVMQFGSSKIDDIQSTPVMQFGTAKVDDKKSTPVVQFSASKADDKHSSPVVQFGIPKINDKQSASVMPFGASKIDGQHQPTLPLMFGTTKESENKTSTQSLFSFGNNQKSNEKSTEPVKFQFGSSKPDVSVAASTTESKNVVFGSNGLQNQNLFSFGKTNNISSSTGDPPKYDAPIEKSTPQIQFGALPTSPFGTSNADLSKPQFSTSVGQSVDSQGPKLVFGSQISENKPAISTSGVLFANNLPNPIFQFNSSSSKPNDKVSEVPSNSFPFSSTKTAPTFVASALQNFGDKPAYQFNAKKPEELKTQFSTPTFGSQSTTTTAPFKFGGNDKPASFGSTFSSNQPLQFTNNEKTIKPFKFGSTVPSSNTFQFSSNKTDNNQVKFGQTSNTFSSTPGFSGFGSSALQQANAFSSVPPSQPSPFGNITSPNAASTFGNVASPTSNSFGTNQGFQFGGSNNAPSSSSTFAFGSNSQPTKPDGTFSFNAAPTTATASPFQFGQASSPPASTSQFGSPPPQGAAFNFGTPSMTTNAMAESNQPLFSVGTAPAIERRKAKAVRRRQ